MFIEVVILVLGVLLSPNIYESTAYTQQVPVTDAELNALGETLWSMDVNNVFNLITVNVQGSTTSYGRDNAPQHLLSVQPQAYQKPTIAKLIALQDNYVPDVGTKEIVTTQESLEETEFLDAILNTTVMKKAGQFLIEKGYIGETRSSPRINPIRQSNNNANNNEDNTLFRNALKEIWFGLYSRQGSTLGSCGFEHSFLGEIKNGEVSGFHNWVYFARQEGKDLVNYNGHIRILRLGSKGMVLKYNFKWNTTPKPLTSMFVGTSPEFEMAVYTICFYTRSGSRCPLMLNGKFVQIKTHFITRAGKKYVASAFPDI